MARRTGIILAFLVTVSVFDMPGQRLVAASPPASKTKQQGNAEAGRSYPPPSPRTERMRILASTIVQPCPEGRARIGFRSSSAISGTASTS